ncbi:hypothetical protein NBRC116594_34520 [Shimia sp. NS0008-38b]|uniref:hypothetical protein n=1 Tax=Shimia sp. NS0008-38b TaxID=3127653 RepID=UPI0031083704
MKRTIVDRVEVEAGFVDVMLSQTSQDVRMVLIAGRDMETLFALNALKLRVAQF